MEEKNKKTKLITILVIFAIIAIGIAGVILFTKVDNNEENNNIEQVEEPKEITKTNYMNIDGIYVDNSYKDKDNENLKLVYLFYTVSSNDKNFKVDSQSAKIIIESNTYDNTKNLKGVCKYMSNYYYRDYLKDVYVGDTLKVVETFKIPSAELTEGKNIKIQKSQIPETENIKLLTDSIVFCDSVEAIAEKVDPEGYANEVNKRAEADQETDARVKKAINDYYFTFYVNRTSYKLSFSSPNEFELKTALGTNTGTYSVKNGYIFCSYPSNGYTVEIPYEWKENGDIKLDTTTAFDVRE